MAQWRRLKEEVEVLKAFMAVETGKSQSIEKYLQDNRKTLDEGAIEALEAIAKKQY